MIRKALALLALLAAILFSSSAVAQGIPTSPFSGLPSSPTGGDLAFITDGSGTPTVGEAAVGGGANRDLVAFDAGQSRWEFVQRLPATAPSAALEPVTSADRISYSNTLSGATATDTQAALDEVFAGTSAAWRYVPDVTSPTMGLQELLDAACALPGPQVIEFGEGSTVVNYTAQSGTALSDGIIDFPEKCNEITFRGQGKNTSKLEFLYDLTAADASGLSTDPAVIDLRVFRLRGSRWIKFEEMQIAARNVCNRDFDYSGNGSETCISDGKILFSIDEAADGTPSRNVVFDNVHLHFPSTYTFQAQFGEFPNVVRAVNSEEIHIMNSVLHGNGFLALVDDCLSCTINYNWFGSAFPLSEGPHGLWHDPTPPYIAPAADQGNADYTREMQGAIVLGVGEGKEAIGNRIDLTQLPWSAIEDRTFNATGGVVMASVLDLSGEVPRGAIVSNNTIYNVMDKSMGAFYFINYNGAMVSGNSVTCADLVDPSNCAGGSLVRIINQADDAPDDPYNRENTFLGNIALGFPTDYATANGDEVKELSSCITIYAPRAADVAKYAEPSHSDNTFIGNACDSVGTIFAHNGDESSVAGIDVLARQNWGRGNLDLSTGREYGVGPASFVADGTLRTSQICGQFVNDFGNAAGVTMTLPVVTPEAGALGCWFKAANISNQPFKLCADGQYFAVINDPDTTTGSSCAVGATFTETLEAVTVIDKELAVTSVLFGATTTIGYDAGATVSAFEAGERIYLSGLGGSVELNGREYEIASQSGTGSSATLTLNTLEGPALNSTGFTAWTSGGTIRRYGWVAIANNGFDSAAP